MYEAKVPQYCRNRRCKDSDVILRGRMWPMR
jgi:hypothetical protein